MRNAFWSVLLTLSSLLGLGTMVYFIMHFATDSLSLPMAYWLVPLFGAVGGAVGGVLRNDNKLALSVIELPDKVHLGTVGDICIGLGGACAVSFLFGNTLRIDPRSDALSSVLLISISFLAGAFGKDIVELAGEKFLAKATAAAQEAAKAEVSPLSAKLYAIATTEMIKEGKFHEALELAEQALKIDPTNIRAHIEKARVLRALGKVREALATINKALSLQPDKAYESAICLYNRACYMSILRMNPAQILPDIEKAFQLARELIRDAATDEDFKSLRGLPEFRNLFPEEFRNLIPQEEGPH